MEPHEFDRWCAEVVMGWEVYIESRFDGLVYADKEHYRLGNGCAIFSGHWHPSRSLDQMREVEIVLNYPTIQEHYIMALTRIVLSGETGGDSWFLRVTASCEQRMAAIVSIKDEIERVINAQR